MNARTSCLLALLPIAVVASCNDPAASATVIDVTVRFDDKLVLDQVRVTLEVDDGDSFTPFVAPELPRTLDAAGELLEVLLPDDVGGHQVTVLVEGLAGGEPLAFGEGIVDALTRARAGVIVVLEAPGPDGACGDGAVAGTEECDDENRADGDGCSVECAIEPGFTCAGTPSVCSETCGNGLADDGEDCDDENLTEGDGCTDNCTVEPGFTCTGTPSVCSETCGNGNVDTGEGCDDEDLAPGDGCSDACAIEPGFICTGEPSVCSETCGNGSVDDGEGCDDDALAPGDGCSATCTVEVGFACSGEPSSCARTCDNGALDPGETCDDGGAEDGDGCSASCALEPGFACDVAGSPCVAVCGDGLLRGAEACDDDDTDAGDGCDALCATEAGFLCTGAPSTCVAACVIAGVDVLDGALDPGNPCRACRSTVDPTAYVDVDDGTSCQDGLFCNGADTCSSGACVSTGSPCAASTPLCLEAADLCSCAGSSCSNGSFCDGAETCEPDGSCLDGTALACAPEICSESASGCVECDSDTDCAAPNPSCFQERCTECPTCPCKFGEHDGGAGECVPLGDCSQGFALGFIDADLDGVGAGALLDDCNAFPFAAGLSAESTDCDDGNIGVFRSVALFADNDLDGFTAGAAVAQCIGANVPANRRQVASPPPNVSFEAGSVTETDVTGPRGWATFANVTRAGFGDAEVVLDAPQITESLSLTNFDLRVPAGATIRGIAVHIHRRTRTSSSGSGRDRVVSLLGGTGTSANRADLVTPWPFSPGGGAPAFTEAVYGGPTDLWGMTFSQAQVNANAFGVLVNAQTTAGASNAEPEIDHIWVEVFTSAGDDCADANIAVYSSRPSFTDVDSDRFGAGGIETSRCVGEALPVGVSQRSLGNDCFDTNDDVFPGQTQFFDIARGGGGANAFDYNCDNVITVQSITQETACSCNTVTGTCGSTSAASTPSAASCGGTASDDFCAPNDGQCIIGGTDIGCVLVQDTSDVFCR